MAPRNTRDAANPVAEKAEIPVNDPSGHGAISTIGDAEQVDGGLAQSTPEEGWPTNTDGTVVPVSRDETHDSIDIASGTLTEDAVARRRDMTGDHASRVETAQAKLRAAESELEEARKEDAETDGRVTEAEGKVDVAKSDADQAQKDFDANGADEVAARAAGEKFEGDGLHADRMQIDAAAEDLLK